MTASGDIEGQQREAPAPGHPVPAQNAPAQNAPAQNAPAQNAPAQNAPAQNAPAQPAPAAVAPMPSPYLEAGESIPEAYPAPPQPGQPGYGTPPANGMGERAFRAGTQYGQPSYGQPSTSQPTYRRPGARNTLGISTRARRDPVLAGAWERIAASLLDWLIILAVPVAVFFPSLLKIWRQLQSIASTNPDLNSPAARAAINAISRDPATLATLLRYWLTVFGFALAYYWILHLIWGATLGKRALGMRVVSAADQSRIGARAAGLRAVAFLVGPAIFIILASPFNLIGGMLWVADSGLALLDPRAQSLHDKVAGTVVIRQRWLERQRARPPSP